MQRPRPSAVILFLSAALGIGGLGGACRQSGTEVPQGTQGTAATRGTEPAMSPTPPEDTAPAPTVPPAQGTEEARAARPETWHHPGPPADVPADRPLRAGFLVVDGVYNSELMAPYDVFQHTVFHTKPRPGIEVFTVSPDGRPVTTYEGIQIVPKYSFANAPAIDVLVVPSAQGSMDKDLQNAALIDWVRRVGSQARYVVSLCDGAFVLAQAGLLDGLPATTFPDDYDRFAKAFPKVEMRINVSFVHSGKFLTSEGGAQSYTVAMHLVDWLYGQEVAKAIGHGLLIPWPRTASEPGIVEPAPPAGTETPQGTQGTEL